MTEEIKQEALDTLVVMITAIKNFRLYPSSSAIIVNTIDKLHQAFLSIFALDKSLTFAESEKNLLICGEPLSQKDHERMQVIAMLDILQSFGIRSITFNDGLEKKEIITLLECFSQKPENIKNEGGLSQIISAGNIPHILLDEKVYVVRDKNKQILTGLDITDDKIISFLSKSHPELSANREKMLEMIGNPECLLESFQAGMQKIMDDKGTSSKLQLSENLIKMIELMDKVSAPLDKKEQDKISEGIGMSFSLIDSPVVRQIVSQNIEHLFGGMLMKYIADDLMEILPTDRRSGEDAGNNMAGAEGQSFSIEQGIALLLNDSKNAVLDDSLIAALPQIIENIIAEKQQKTFASVVNNIMENMFAEDVKVREQAAEAMVKIIESFTSSQKIKFINILSDKLPDWIKLATNATPAFEKICGYMRDLVQDFINQRRFTETIPILDVFNNINTGILEKNDTINKISGEFIRTMASKENLEVLFNLFNDPEQRIQAEASEILIRLGDAALNWLLDRLREHDDSNERVRIMRVIINAGQRAIPAVRDRITKNAAWYYLRNIAYILGHIGNEASAEFLQPLLLHENEKVRQEALKSINRTGGNKRYNRLLSMLPQVDDKLKLDIIEMIGNAKCADVAADIASLLETSHLKDKSLRADMEEKVCNALGLIGSPAAIPALSRVAESKSILGISRYSKQVKVAANRALIYIKKAQRKG